MKFSNYSAVLALALILYPAVSMAGLNKCTDAKGVVTYSDQPCSAKDGQKAAEIKNGTGLAAYAGRESDQQIARTCASLQQKKNLCSYSAIESNLNTAFNENCEGPIRRDYLEKQRQQYEQYRDGRYYRNQREEQNEERSETKMSCADVQAAIWKFVKESFGEKLTANEIKAIEYNLQAVPDSYDNSSYSRRRR